MLIIVDRWCSRAFPNMIVILLLTTSVWAAGDCSMEIVQQASFNEFLQFAILNCDRGDAITKVTMKGTQPLSPFDCLVRFNAMNQGQNPIPDKGACRDDFLRLFQFISTISFADAGFEYENTTKIISFNYEGFDTTVDGFEEFMDRTGHPVVLNACDPNYVRRQSLAGFYRNAIAGILSDGTRDYNVDSVEADGFSDSQYQPLSMGLCVGCYQAFLDFVQEGVMDPKSQQFSFSNFPSNILAKCVYDPQGHDCMSSTQVQQLRSDFTQCAGSNLQVDFLGPLCTKDVSLKIHDINLFNRAVFCTINHHPFVPGCETWNTDYLILPGELLSDCVICVADLVADVKSILNTTRNATLSYACSSMEDSSSAACINELGSSAVAFSNCAGISIEDLKLAKNINLGSPMEGVGSNPSVSSSQRYALPEMFLLILWLFM